MEPDSAFTKHLNARESVAIVVPAHDAVPEARDLENGPVRRNVARMSEHQQQLTVEI
jgi:hypothetical protein